MSKHVKHNLGGTKFYAIYHNLRSRCKRQGAVFGWQHFVEFRDDMYESYRRLQQKHDELVMIDCHDPLKPYDRDNCFWTVRTRHSSNKGRLKIDHIKLWKLVEKYYLNYGESPAVKMLARNFKVSVPAIYYWLRRFEAKGLITMYKPNINKKGFFIQARNVKKV